MNLLTPILNRDGVLPDNGGGWFHLVPRGEYPHPGSGLVQILDDAAFEAMTNRFQAEAAKPNFAGILVDQEHWSYEPDRSSEAFGWIREIQNRADGLWGRIDWTDLGKAALTNKRYKFVSPVWMPNQVESLGNKKVRPLRLDSAGLTNNPNLRGMVPLTNRAGESPADKTAVQKNTYMKSVAAALGLSAEASEEAILAAVTALRNRADTAEGEVKPLKNRVTVLETENATLKDAQIEEDLKPLTNRAKPEVIASFKSSLKADRNAALPGLQAFIATLGTKSPAAGAITNRQTAGNPERQPGNTDGEDGEDRAGEQEALIQQIRIANKCTYKDAANLARRQKPELFAPVA